jgi:hypothetical protein
MRTEVFIQVQRNLAVRVGAESMAALLQFAPLTLEVIKLAVDDDMNAFVFARDRLISGREVNDAQSRMTEADALIGGKPGALTVRTAVMESVRSELQRRL